MKLSRVRIQNYRSIVDSGEVEIEERVTVLIGKNEQGKTMFLRGMASFGQNKQYVPNDLPNHLRVELERKKASDIPIATLQFQLDDSDRTALGSTIEKPVEISRVVVTKHFDNSYTYKIVRDDNSHTDIKFKTPDIGSHVDELRRITNQFRTKLQAHAQRQSAFNPSLNQAEQHIDTFLGSNFSVAGQLDDLLKTLQVTLAGVPGLDAPIQEDIASVAREIRVVLDQVKQTLSANPTHVLWALFPQFVAHSTSIDRIPNQVSLAEFINDTDATSPGMAKLCRVAGISIQKIQELSAMDASAREAYEDSYRELFLVLSMSTGHKRCTAYILELKRNVCPFL